MLVKNGAEDSERDVSNVVAESPPKRIISCLVVHNSNSFLSNNLSIFLYRDNNKLSHTMDHVLPSQGCMKGQAAFWTMSGRVLVEVE